MIKTTNDQLENFDITPDVHLIKRMGQKGYKLWQAISELIDNAIDARREDIKPLIIEVRFGPKNSKEIKWVEVRDYGKGMTYKKLKNCMKLAYVDPEEQKKKKLGKFGLGLKTASSSIGAKFTIITKYYENEEDTVFSLVYDEPKFIKNDKWRIKPNCKEDPDFKSGTLIKIEELAERGTKIYRNKVKRMIGLFSMQYGPYIKSGELQLKIDTLTKKNPIKTVEPYEFDLLNDEKHKIEFTLGDRKVRGWVGFLKHKTKGVSKGFYGFNLYWKNRLVGLHKKIGFRAHAERWRIIGELYLDDFPITNDKKDFIWSHSSMEKLVGPEKEEGTYDYKHGALHKAIKPYIEEFEKHKKERRAVLREIEEVISHESLPLKEGKDIKRRLNKNEITPSEAKEEVSEKVQRYIKKLKEKGNKIEAKKKIAESIKNSSKASITEKEDKTKEIEGKIKYNDLHSPLFKFTINEENGKKSYTVFHKTKNMGSHANQYELEENKDGEMVVVSNLDHPLLSLCENLQFLYDMQKVEAITNKILELKRLDFDKKTFLKQRELICREYVKQKKALAKKEELEKEKKQIERDSSSEF